MEGTILKRRSIWFTRFSAVALSAMLIAACPGTALAQESQESRESQAAQEERPVNAGENGGSQQNQSEGTTATESAVKEEAEQTGDDALQSGQSESCSETAESSNTDNNTDNNTEGSTGQTEGSDGTEQQTPAEGEQPSDDGDGELPPDWDGELPPDWDGELPPGWDGELPPGGGTEIPTGPVTVVLPMESGEEYELLSQFLALSSDQFSVYTVAFIDPVTGTPVQPEEAVEVTLSIPSGYDMSRVVVSEITMSGETPSRTEISYTNENNSAVFKTDHAGLYVVMEKKVQAELPPSLEMTDKVEKLKLTKTLPTSLSYTSASGTYSANPQTGDDANVIVWVCVAAAAVVLIVGGIVIIRKRR